jgi:AraC family transcriptional regulator
MYLRTEKIQEKKLVGKRLKMSLSDDKTVILWQSFMPQRKGILNTVSADLYAMQIYDTPQYFDRFDPTTLFEKWATVEVTDFDTVPEGMETVTLTSGLYAVFLHKGTVATAHLTFGYIFGTWLPNSIYALDDRPHFEILGDKYKNNDPNSEEEVWVPIKTKAK